MKKITFIVLSLIGIAGCRKKDHTIPDYNTSVDFTFVDYYTNQPIPGYILKISYFTYFLGWRTVHDVTDLTTDINGNVKFQVFDKEYKNYHIANWNTDSVYTGFNTSLVHGKKNIQTIRLKKWIPCKIEFKNKTLKYNLISISRWKDYPGLDYDGTFKDMSVIIKDLTEGSTTLYMNFSHSNNPGVFTNKDTTFVIPKVDTFYLKLQY